MKINELYLIMKACVDNGEGEWDLLVETFGDIYYIDMSDVLLLKDSNSGCPRDINGNG